VVQTIFTIKGKKHSYFGGAALEQDLKAQMKLENPGNEKYITNTLIKDVICKVLKTLSRKQFDAFFATEESIEKMKQKKYPLSEMSRRYEALSMSYHTIAGTMECFFDQGGTDQYINIAHMILDCLLELEESDRTLAAQNIIPSGGLFMIPGMHRRLLGELQYSVENIDKYKGLIGLKDKFRVENSIYPANILAWVGASLLSCLNEEVDMFLISKGEFEKDCKGILPDRFGH